ncbi:MAG TPA: phosphoglycerate mutase family protein [Longimicrobiaceae bacterium]
MLTALVVSTGAGAQRRQTARQQPTTVILVRHAEKFTGNPLDQNPPLSPEGWQRARDLYRLLKGRHVQAIITTQLDRTRMTARPAADSLHIVPEELDAQTPAASVAELIRTRHAGQTVLVVGHGNTVTKIIAALGGPTLGDICDSAYSNIFTLVVPRSGTPRLTHAHYGAADPPGDHDCVDGIKEEHHSR